jgi:autotransporter-associated beta strand protein
MKPKSYLRHYCGSHLARPLVTTSVISMSFLGAMAQAGEYTYRYFKFTPTASNTSNQTQLSEFNFLYKGQKLNLMAAVDGVESTGAGPVKTVTMTGGVAEVTAGEGAYKLIDGDVTTKMFSNSLAELTFDFGSAVTIDSYNFATANDSVDRTPTAWTFQGSNNGVDYVTIDSRTAQAPLYNTTFTYQNGFALPNAAGVPVINSISTLTPAVIAPGESSMLTYDIGNTPTSVILNPGGVDITATPSFFVDPTETTKYTITATNASGTSTKTFEVRVSAPEVSTFRYVRFTPLQTRVPSATIIQIAEFELFSGGNKLTGLTATNPGGRSPSANEDASKIVDGNTGTKWLDFNKQGLIFDLGTSQSFDSVQFTTGNDATDRDVVRWVLEGSDDATSWTTLQVMGSDDYPIPVGRGSQTGLIPLSYNPLVWTGSISDAWNTTVKNFNGPSAYVPSKGVLFNEAPAVKAVSITEQLLPTSIAFNNTSPYTISGSATYGTGTIIKNGSGSATFNNVNSLNGGTIVNKGSLIGPAVKSFGEVNAPGRMIIQGGGEIGFTSPTQYNQRTWYINDGAVNVASGAKLTHTGPIRVVGNFTKTGEGTLSMQAIGGTVTATPHNFVVNSGVLEFTTGYFNSFNFVGNKLLATVNTGATLRGTTGSAFGGDYIDAAPGIGQFRINGGTYEHTGGIQYLSNGLVTTGEVAQGRIVLSGGTITGGGQIESARNRNATNDLDATNNLRTVISTEANAASSQITGSGLLIVNTGHLVLDVAQGAAPDDLVISKTIGGNYGIIKEGAGNLILTAANNYTGKTATDAPTNPLPLAFDLPDGTTVRAGTLTLRNTEGTATGLPPVSIKAGATLAGLGSSVGALTALGNLAPGDDALDKPIGTLTVGPTTLSGTYVCQVNGAPGGEPNKSGADLLAINGDLNLGASSSLQIVPVGAGLDQSSYVVATFTGSLTGASKFATTPGLPAGYSVVVDAAAHEIRIVTGVPVTGYDAFIAGTTLQGADALPKADPDFDGLSNLIEFVVGANPQVSSQAEVPTMVRDTLTGSFVFTFRRTTASASVNPLVEYSTGLVGGSWSPASGQPGVTTVVTPGGPGVEIVVVTLPSTLAADGKLFARLTATH